MLHQPNQLSSKAKAVIDLEEPQNGLLVSTISVWEIAVKSSIGKLSLPLPIDKWYELAQAHSGIVIEALASVDAIASTQLPGSFHCIPSRQDFNCDRKTIQYFSCNLRCPDSKLPSCANNLVID